MSEFNTVLQNLAAALVDCADGRAEVWSELPTPVSFTLERPQEALCISDFDCENLLDWTDVHSSSRENYCGGILAQWNALRDEVMSCVLSGYGVNGCIITPHNKGFNRGLCGFVHIKVDDDTLNFSAHLPYAPLLGAVQYLTPWLAAVQETFSIEVRQAIPELRLGNLTIVIGSLGEQVTDTLITYAEQAANIPPVEVPWTNAHVAAWSALRLRIHKTIKQLNPCDDSLFTFGL